MIVHSSYHPFRSHLEFHAGGVFAERPEDVTELGGVYAAVAVLVELAEGVVVLADIARAHAHPTFDPMTENNSYVLTTGLGIQNVPKKIHTGSVFRSVARFCQIFAQNSAG